MNIILHFAIICACAIHVHSRTKEAPSPDDLLFFNELMQNAEHFETKNEPAAPLDTNNQIDGSDILFELFSPHQEQRAEKKTKASSSHTDRKIDVSAANENQMMVERDTDGVFDLSELFAPKENVLKREAEASSKINDEEEFSVLLNNLFSQRDQTMNANPKHPHNTDGVFDLSELFAPKEKVMEREAETPSKINDEEEFSVLLNNLLSQQDQTMKVNPKHPHNTDGVFDLSELFAPEEKVVEQKAKASHTEDEFDILELLNNVISEREQSVNVEPKSATKTNSEIDVPELLRDLIFGSEEKLMEKVPKATSKTENDIDISKLLDDLVSSPNEEVIEMVPISSPKIGKELDMPDVVIEIMQPPKEPDMVIEIDEQIISINMSLIEPVPKYEESLNTDEKNEYSSQHNLTTKMNQFFSDVIFPLQNQLLDQFERALVPLNDIIELGAGINNSPFTEKEIKKLGIFTVYMQTTHEIFDEFKSKVYSFGADRFFETSVLKTYHLSEKQNNHTQKVINDAIKRCRTESKAIYDLILKPENQQLIKSIENKKLELSNSLRTISLALKANYAHLIDDNQMEDVKTKNLSIIEQNSKSIIELIQSKTLETLGDKIITHVYKLVEIMKKLPMEITLSYMF